MDENQLGRNTQHLRKIYGETLDALGTVVDYERSTVKGYESGARKPSLETLNIIAAHYGKTVDELLHTDLTGLEKISFTVDSNAQMTSLYEVIMPRFTSEKCMKNEHFQIASEYCARILSAFSNGETLRGSIIVDVFQEFTAALEQIEEPAIVANVIWSIFLWWSQIIDVKQAFAIQNKLLSRKVGIMEMVAAKHNEPKDIKGKKAGFITDFDGLLSELIKALKSDEQWSDLGDYYLALRYVEGLIDTDYSTEMNSAIGMQMMMSFARLENKYALRFLKTCASA